jgi:hypothetical protein
MWVRVFDFFTGEELGKSLCFKVFVYTCLSWYLQLVLEYSCCNLTPYDESLVLRLACYSNCLFSRTRARAAYHFIKKKK